MTIARIIIVNYNCGAFIDEAIESALAQTLPVEVVVVDNQSTDGSPERIAAMSGVRLVRREANDGFGAAVNTGASDATTPYIALLNPDAQASPEWLAVLTSWMDRHSVDVACSYVSAGDGYYFVRGRWVWWLGGTEDDLTPSAHGDVQRTDFVNGCAMVVRTELFKRLGGFDERIFLYSDDVDLSLRAASLGRRIGVYPHVLARHDNPGSSTTSLGDRKWIHSFYSRGRVVAKHCPSWVRPLALFVQAYIVTTRFAGGLGPAKPFRRAVLSGYNDARREKFARL